jgi:protein-disulfide isomerase
MKKHLLAGVILSALFSTTALAALSSQQEQQLEEINTFLKENPETISGLHTSLQQYLAGKEQAEKAQANSHDWLYNNPAHPIMGNPGSKNIIINFTDYNCPYCKRLEKALGQLVEENNDIKVINVYMSFKQQKLDKIDTNSALYAMNVWQQKPEAYSEVHDLLVAKSGLHTTRSLEAVAKRTGTEDLLKSTPELDSVLTTNHQTFSALGLTGTPTMIINGQLLPGYMPYDRLKDVVDQAF